jgi:hypothetical protein
MHKLVPLIEKVILSSFPDVMEVDFEEVGSYLGSSPELPEKERTIKKTLIVVTINNLKKGYTWYQLSNLKNQIIEKVESYFNLDWREYGSKWAFEFYQARTEKI